MIDGIYLQGKKFGTDAAPSGKAVAFTASSGKCETRRSTTFKFFYD